MASKIAILVAITEPLFADGIVNAIMATDDLEVVAKPKERTETITLIQELQPRVAIIDLDLFGRDVFQAIREIKKEHESVAILAVVSRTTSSCLRQSLQAGVAGYLLKKATATEFINAIRGICAGEAVLNLQSVYELMQHLDYAMDEQGHLGKAPHLSRRELEVLKLSSKGLSNKKIARELFISERTVQSQFGAIFGKLGVASRTEAVLAAWRKGWITEEDIVD
jgi:DNA-binding NarL/FixJ family response regulator